MAVTLGTEASVPSSRESLVNSALEQLDLNDDPPASENEIEDAYESQYGSAEEISTSEAPEATKVEAPAEGDEVEYSFTDHLGVKQTSKFNLKDREALKKELSLARGARKWQAERDQAAKKIKEIEPQLKDFKESWDAVQRAWDTDGVKGIVNLLSGTEEGFSKFEKELIDKANIRANASPSDLEKLDLIERLEKGEKEKERTAKMLKAKEESIAKQKADAEAAELTSMVNPAFEKIRFAGKLGDQALEDQLDEAIWTQAIRKLEKLPQDVALSPALVSSTFEEVAGNFKKAIGKQTEAKVTETIQNKKADAQTKVAAAASRGVTKGNKEEDLRAAMGGNSASVLNAMRKAMGL